MITEEEKEEIINKAIEKTLLMIPEVIGNMMTQHVALAKLNTQFYSDYPEFKDHKNVVASVIEMIDGQNPNCEYQKLLSMAIPEIRNRLSNTKDLNMIDVTNSPNRDFSRANGAL